MRLNNKELKVVVDEIFKRVSQPIVDKNSEIEKTLVIEDETISDFNEYQRLQGKIDLLVEEQSVISSKYRNQIVNGYGFGWAPLVKNGEIANYIRKQKSMSDKLMKYPTKEEIEAQIIISGYSEIPELISRICEMYQ